MDIQNTICKVNNTLNVHFHRNGRLFRNCPTNIAEICLPHSFHQLFWCTFGSDLIQYVEPAFTAMQHFIVENEI